MTIQITPAQFFGRGEPGQDVPAPSASAETTPVKPPAWSWPWL